MTEKTLLDYWLVLYRRKVAIFIVTISAMVTALILSKTLHPVYEGKAVFFVPKEPDIATFFAPPGGTIGRSPLAPDPSEDPNAPYIGILKSKAMKNLIQKEFPHKTNMDLSITDVDFTLTDEYMIEIYVRDRNPRLAADIANAYVKYFRQLMDDYSLKAQLGRQATMEEEIARNQKSLSESREKLSDFQQENRTANLDEEIKQLISMKSNFESQLETHHVEYAENKNKILATKRKLKDENQTFNISNIVITSPILEKLKVQMSDLDSKMAALSVEIKEPHPEYKILKKNYEEVKKNIDKEIEYIIKSKIKAPDTFYENLRRQVINLYVEKERIAADINGTKKVLKVIGDRIQEIPELKRQLDILVTEVDRHKKLVDTRVVNLEEVKSQIKRSPEVAVQVEEATPPSRPSFPIWWLNVIVATLVGLVVGIFYCFFLDYLEGARVGMTYRLVKAIESTKDEK